MVRRLRVYPDTSVFGAPFDAEFADASEPFWRAVRAGRFDVLVSGLTVSEVEKAPETVRRLLGEIPAGCRRDLVSGPEAEELAEAFLAHGALSRSMANDALHIALAIVGGADLLLSWNFKHMVNVRRIRLFHAVAVELGYTPIDIRTPKEVGET